MSTPVSKPVAGARFSRLAQYWLPALMLLTLIGGLLSIARLTVSVGKPFPGIMLLWRKENKMFTVGWNTPPDWSGLADGKLMIDDRILCIDGYRPYTGLAPDQMFFALNPQYGTKPCPNGDRYYPTIVQDAFLSAPANPKLDFRVDRNGVVQTVQNVPLLLFSPYRLVEILAPALLLGLALLGLGFVVYRADPRGEVNLVFGLIMVASCNFAFNGAMAGIITGLEFETGKLTVIQMVPWAALLGTFLFHFIDLLSSPGPLSAASRLIRRPYYLFAALFAALGMTVFIFSNTPSLQPLMFIFIGWVVLSAVFAVLWSLVSLVLAYRRSTQPQVRGQTGLVLFALVVGILVCLPFVRLFFIRELTFPYLQELPYAGLLVLAIIAYAILRYQLFAARAQTLTFLLVLVASLIAALIVHLLIGKQVGFFPMLGSSLLAGGVFAGRFKPLGFLDRLLHHEELDYLMVDRFSQKINQHPNLTSLAETAVHTLKELLETKQVELWLSDPDQATLEHHSRQHPERLPLNPELAAWIAQTVAPVYANTITGQGFTGSLLTVARNHPNGLWVPLNDHGQALGLLYLAPRWTGEVYSEDDLRLVRLLAGQLRLAIVNIQQVGRLHIMQHLILQAEENERYKIARELHDTVLQFMQIITLKLNRIKDNPAHLDEQIETLQGGVSKESKNLRDLLGYLRTAETLEQRGLLQPLETLFTTMRGQTDTMLEWELDPQVEDVLPVENKLILYRVLREATQNAIKHAQARRITIHLHKKEEQIAFMVRDDGQGFDLHKAYETAAKGYNSLQDMRFYIESSGGQFEVQSTPGAGTLIQGWTPGLPATATTN